MNRTTEFKNALRTVTSAYMDFYSNGGAVQLQEQFDQAVGVKLEAFIAKWGPEHMIAAFLERSGQYLTNDATREAAIAEAVREAGAVSPADRDALTAAAGLLAGAGHHDCSAAVLRASQAAAAGNQEPTYEQLHALCEAHEIAGSDSYFEARPAVDDKPGRKLFRDGFTRGFDAGYALRAEASTAGQINYTTKQGAAA